MAGWHHQLDGHEFELTLGYDCVLGKQRARTVHFRFEKVMRSFQRICRLSFRAKRFLNRNRTEKTVLFFRRSAFTAPRLAQATLAFVELITRKARVLQRRRGVEAQA